jgi:L-fucose isomerase-like protein
MRVGAIGLGDPGYLEELAQQRHQEAVAEVSRTVHDLVDVGLHCDETQGGAAVDRLVKQHAEKPFDAIFVMQVSWSRPAVALQLVRALPQLPMVVYSPGGKIENGVIHSIAPAAGAGSTIPLLRSHGIKFKYVWSVPGQAIEEAAFMPFLRAAAAVRRLRGAKLGMVGFGDMRLQMSAFDIQELHRTFGVEVDSVDMLELQNAMEGLDEQFVLGQAEKLTAGWRYHDNRTPSPAALRKVVGAYLVLDRWANERGWVGVSIKCPTGVAAHMGFTPCMVACLLARRLHFVCENDIPGLLTQVILGLLSGEMSTYWELYEILGDGILLGCCGFCPEALLDEPMKVRVIEQFLTGLGCCARPRLGPYTLARLGKDNAGKYLFHRTEGEAAAPPPWFEVPVGMPQHPSVNFVPDVPVVQVLEDVLAQHFAVVPGRWRESVDEFARLTGVGVI